MCLFFSLLMLTNSCFQHSPVTSSGVFENMLITLLYQLGDSISSGRIFILGA